MHDSTRPSRPQENSSPNRGAADVPRGRAKPGACPGVFLPDAILSLQDLTHGQRLILAHLKQLGSKSGRVFIGLRECARRLDLSERAVELAFEIFRVMGFLRPVGTALVGRGHTREYTIRAPEDNDGAPQEARKGAKSAAFRGARKGAKSALEGRKKCPSNAQKVRPIEYRTKGRTEQGKDISPLPLRQPDLQKRTEAKMTAREQRREAEAKDARELVKFYGLRVKSAVEDGSSDQAKINIAMRLHGGRESEDLAWAIVNYGRQCDEQGRRRGLRMIAANFFGEGKAFRDYLPGGKKTRPESCETSA